MKNIVFLLIGLASLTCHIQTDSDKSQPHIPYVTDQVVVNTIKDLPDGAGYTWKLEPGNYRLEMSANNDGAAAEWVGASCPKTRQMQQLTMDCLMQNTGQLIITNPSTFGLGKNVSVTVKLTKLSH